MAEHAAAQEKPEVAQADFCRHCGAPKAPPNDQDFVEYVPNADADPNNVDWLCGECSHWQDAMICPTCHQQARISSMPTEHHPKVARPKRG